MADAAGLDFGEMSPGMRLSRVAELIDAIYACHPEDRQHVLSVVLEEWQTETPMPPFLDAMSDAEFWAHAATFENLRAVFLAAGQRLARNPLGRRGRIRMIQRLMEGMSDHERQEIMSANPAKFDQG